jgi:hypothetical protein
MRRSAPPERLRGIRHGGAGAAIRRKSPALERVIVARPDEVVVKNGSKAEVELVGFAALVNCDAAS